MKTITLLKILTIVMAFLIVIGFIFVTYKLAEKGQKIKPSSILRSEMTLDFPETITEIMPCGERLCLMTEGHEEGKHLIIVNPEKGYITSVITFKEKNK